MCVLDKICFEYDSLYRGCHSRGLGAVKTPKYCELDNTSLVSLTQQSWTCKQKSRDG